MGAQSQPSQRRPRAFAILAVGMVLGAILVPVSETIAPPPIAVAAPGDPGEPAPPMVVYDEGFENAPDTGFPVLLTNYVSSVGGTYTAAAPWSSYPNCNGFIMSTTNTQSPGSCGNETGGFLSLRKLAYALGTVNGSASPNLNSVNAAYTYNNAPDNAVQFETVTPIQLNTPSRYLTFSVNAAATNCFSFHPRMQFYVKNSASGVESALGGVIDPCSDPRSRVLSTGGLTGGSTQPYRGGSFPASASFVTTSSSIGIVMRNLTGTGAGNDGAFDDIRILDVTPSLDKSFSTPDIGGVSTLTFTVTNTNELASKLGWSATDNLQPGLVVASPSNATSTCSNGTVTAAPGSGTIALAGDIAAGVAFCTFTVDVAPASTPTLEAPQNYQNCAADLSPVVGLDPPSSCATVTFFAPPELQIEKATSATIASRAGDIVNYAVTLRNVGGTGYTVAEPASFTDSLGGILDDATYNGDATATGGAPPPDYAAGVLSWSGPLAAGASVTVNYSVTLTLAGDGVLQNTAAVPGGPLAETLVTVPLVSSLSLVKSATPSDVDSYELGTEITYSFVATNTGNVAITAPQINELTFTGAGALSPLDCTLAPVLMPGAQFVCTATYTLQQADIDAGGINNTATASGTDPDGNTVTSPEDDSPTPTPAAPSVTIEKAAGPGPFTSAGQLVSYSFLVTNTGNVTLTEIGVIDDAALFTGSGPLPPAACDATTLIPGASATCTAMYVLTQADVDQGAIENTAIAAAVAPDGSDISSEADTAVVSITQAPSMTIVKTAGPGGFTAAGEVVTYSFLVTNTGNVTLADIIVSELSFTGSSPLPATECPADELDMLAPGDTMTCTATYTLTQGDIDSGSVANTATASGVPPSGPPISALPSPSQLTFIAAPVLTLEKTADIPVLTAAGQDLVYSFLVTNTGNVTIRDVTIDEGSFTGAGDLTVVTCPPEAAEMLPGATLTCMASYTSTQADIDAGDALINTASVTGVPPSGVTLAAIEDDATVAIEAAAGLSLVKAVDPSEVTGSGVTVAYTFTVTNTGGSTLSGIAVTEVVFTGTGSTPTVDCPAETLAPGESFDCSAEYTTTAADVEAGIVDNVATASALTPDQSTVISNESDAALRVFAPPPVPTIPGLPATGPASMSGLLAIGILTLLTGLALKTLVRRRRTAD